jgi:hypothetical protein
VCAEERGAAGMEEEKGRRKRKRKEKEEKKRKRGGVRVSEGVWGKMGKKERIVGVGPTIGVQKTQLAIFPFFAPVFKVFDRTLSRE